MKKTICIILSALMLLAFAGCDRVFGKKQVTDVSEYGKAESYVNFPAFFPQSIEAYSVNSYSYTLYDYLDLCYEIFLDISATEEQFNSLISEIKSDEGIKAEHKAYYANGYYEIVFEDNYSINEQNDTKINSEDKSLRVGNADIKKVVYNPKTYNIIFECFDAKDTGVYLLSEVSYFNRFGIDQYEYADFLAQ
ncbi:MAG: hypothetical protein ACI4IS_00865 [Acutalibacteraceae bacterium]